MNRVVWGFDNTETCFLLFFLGPFLFDIEWIEDQPIAVLLIYSDHLNKEAVPPNAINFEENWMKTKQRINECNVKHKNKPPYKTLDGWTSFLVIGSIRYVMQFHQTFLQSFANANNRDNLFLVFFHTYILVLFIRLQTDLRLRTNLWNNFNLCKTSTSLCRGVC